MEANKKLVLGIGDNCKNLLRSIEPGFEEATFAILDLWSAVQEILIVDKYVQTDNGVSNQNRIDLSYFVEPPKIDIRFDSSKYADDNTRLIIRNPFDLKKIYEDQLEEQFPIIASSLEDYAHITFVCYNSDFLTLVWLLPLIKHFTSGKTINIFSISTLPFESMSYSQGQELCMDIMDTDARHYVFFNQDLAGKFGDLPVKAFLRKAEQLQIQALKKIISGEAVEIEMVSII